MPATPGATALLGRPTGYTDAEIVTNISNAYLRPTGYLQI